jgi:dipeptidyl aminopeptidase/acylaminoacyl peptidase
MLENPLERRSLFASIARPILAVALVLAGVGAPIPDARAEYEPGEIAVSADGKRVAWVMGWRDLGPHGEHRRIHLLNLSRRGGLRGLAKSFFGSPELPVRNPATKADADALAPAFSPDSQLLGFLSARDGDPDEQFWVLPLEGGEAERWSRIPGGVADYAWAPDGSVFCLSADRLASGRTILRLPPGAGQPEVIHPGDPGIEEIVLSFDGERILYRRSEAMNPSATAESDLWILAVATGETTRLTARPGEERCPCWSDDGEQVFFLSRLSAEEKPPVHGVFGVPAHGGSPELVSRRFEHDILELVTAADTERLFVIASDGANRGLYRIRSREGKATALVTQPGSCRDLAVHRKGEKAFFVREEPGRPPEIASWTFPDEEAKLITDFNADPLASRNPEGGGLVAPWPGGLGLRTEPPRLSGVRVLGSEHFHDGSAATPAAGWLIVSCEFSATAAGAGRRLQLSGREADFAILDARGRETHPVGILLNAGAKPRLVRGHDLFVAIDADSTGGSAKYAFQLAFDSGELAPPVHFRAGDSPPIPLSRDR